MITCTGCVVAGEQFLSLFRDESDDERVLRRMREEEKKKSDVSIGAKEQAGNAIAQTRRKQRMHDVDVIFTTMQGNGCMETSLEQQKIQKNTVDDDEKEEEEEEERRKQRLEKKRFMASKADRILQSTTVECKRRGNSHAKEKLSEREEFKAIAREIQSFGMLFFMYEIQCSHLEGSCMHGTRVFFTSPLASMVKFFHRHLNAVILTGMFTAGS